MDIILQVAENKTLDREQQSVLRLEIEAADTPKGGSEKLKATANILIDVLDVDDNAPTFDKKVYIGNKICTTKLNSRKTRVTTNIYEYTKLFIDNVYSVTAVVPENVPIGISVTNVTATDPDEGLGGEIKLEFLDEGEINGMKSNLYSILLALPYILMFQPSIRHLIL